MVPLFTLQQLWEFIEDKGYQIGTNNFIEKEMYVVKLFESMMQFEPNIEIGDKDKLQAFWKCACEVARIMKREGGN